MARMSWRKKLGATENKYEQFFKLKGIIEATPRDSLEDRAREAERKWLQERGLTKFLSKKRRKQNDAVR